MSISTTPEYILAANTANFDTLISLVNTSLNSGEKISVLTLALARSALTDQFEAGKQLLRSTDLNDALSLHSSNFQQLIEKLLAYGRNVYGISSETQKDLFSLFEEKQAELNKSAASAIDQFAKSSSNSNIAAAAVKSALSAANSAFENANKAVRQVAEITDASVNAATNATVRTVGSAAAPRKKAA